MTTVTLVDDNGAPLAPGGLVRAPATYRGGTIATASTSQQLMAANPTRRGFTVQNQSAGPLYIRIGGSDATLDRFSLKILPDVLYESPPHHVSGGEIRIIGATAGQAFYATEF